MPDSTVSFEILLRTAGSGHLPTARTIDHFRPDPEIMESCRRWLHAHSVVVHPTDFSLACSAAPAVFESLFGVKLVALDPAPGDPRWRIEGTLRVPEAISAWVEDVTLPPPPELF